MALIEKEAKSKTNFSYPRNFASSARAALAAILSHLKLKGMNGVLLPAYIGLSSTEGSGVFDPVQTSGLEPDFYRIDELLRPDMTDVVLKLKTGKFGVVLLIHYFGISQVVVEEFCKICKSYGALVIEDCAHTLTGGHDCQQLGTFGDFGIFSIHKSAPTVDGGFFYDKQNMLESENASAPDPISIETLSAFASFDVTSALHRRRANYERVLKSAQSIPELRPMFPEIGPNTVPLNCPVLVSGGKREALYFALRDRGVLTTALYHTLIPQISKSAFPISHFVAANILNLPTHHDINEQMLTQYLDLLGESIDSVYRP